ncbi:MAG TPA: fluoride efflux transporter CrcB [Alphaproteobacteria bacterium]|jgi:CrcB protein
MGMVAAVAVGGALGSVARYATMLWMARLFGGGFPYGTLAVNMVGGFVMGLLIEAMALAWSPSEAMRAFIAVGVLGGFTTFSTFSLDSWLLIQRGDYGLAALYIGASLLLSIGGLVAGLYLTRTVLA